MSGEIEALNTLARTTLNTELFRCCGCQTWVDNMLKQFPFVDINDLMDRANSTWWLLSVAEWKVAFAAHPKIGVAKILN